MAERSKKEPRKKKEAKPPEQTALVKRKPKKLYADLGLDDTATESEIKDAYRALARQHHPDKQNSQTDERMVSINLAYACLSDPEKKRAYDQTGEQPHANTPDEIARNILLAAFDTMLKTPGVTDYLGYVEQYLEHHIMKAQAAQQTLASERRELEKRRTKIWTVDGDNLVHLLVDRRIEAITEEGVQLFQTIRSHKHALKMLRKQYKAVVEEATTIYPTSAFRGIMQRNRGGPGNFVMIIDDIDYEREG